MQISLVGCGILYHAINIILKLHVSTLHKKAIENIYSLCISPYGSHVYTFNTNLRSKYIICAYAG